MYAGITNMHGSGSTIRGGVGSRKTHIKKKHHMRQSALLARDALRASLPQLPKGPESTGAASGSVRTPPVAIRGLTAPVLAIGLALMPVRYFGSHASPLFWLSCQSIVLVLMLVHYFGPHASPLFWLSWQSIVLALMLVHCFGSNGSPLF